MKLQQKERFKPETQHGTSQWSTLMGLICESFPGRGNTPLVNNSTGCGEFIFPFLLGFGVLSHVKVIMVMYFKIWNTAGHLGTKIAP